MAALAERLAAERQRLPIDVPQPEQATLGGVVATNFSGPRRFRYGTMRDYVIGIRAVDGRGTAFGGGGRVVKNAAGYDLCRLLTGSLGTLGVITQVSLVVKPMVEASAFVACDVPNLETAERLLAGLIHTRTTPAAIELLIGPAWRDDPALGPIPKSAVARLAVGLEGTAAEVNWMTEQLHAEWRKASVPPARTIAGEAADGLWNRLAAFPAAGSSPLVLRINVPPSATTGFVRRLLDLDPECSIEAHAGNGVLRARFASIEAADVPRVLNDQLSLAAATVGGNAVVLKCAHKAELTRRVVWGRGGSTIAVMNALKDQFDPKGLLNPDRFVYQK
jgi:glycolate oxidase FAD binding subunit